MKTHNRQQEGFSLVEMLVVLAIFTTLTLLVLVRNTAFRQVITIENLAYEVALSIQEAQVYGVAVSDVGGQVGDFDAARGVELWSAESNQDPTVYYFGADLDGDRQLEDNEERISSFALSSGFQISQICGSITQQECDVTTQKMSIIFERPNTNAIMIRGGGPPAWIYTEIHVQAPDGNERKVIVTSEGQITVE